MSKMTAAERAKKTPMPEQPAAERRHNFNEVPLGYTPEMAIREASRCLGCKNSPCVKGCPVQVKIPEFIKLMVEGKFAEAARVIKSTNCLPAVCGRVCPQESQCEAECLLGKKNEPVAIGRLERFAADYEREQAGITVPQKAPLNGKKIAIVGAGPSGLTAAGDLALLGYDVTIFEAFHKAGGVLLYGIPEFRLPKAIVQKEVDYLKTLGVKVEVNQVVGKSVEVDELIKQEGYSAVFVGIGAGLPTFLGIPGENLGGVYSANEYLTRANLMKAYRFPEFDTPVVTGKSVCVVGGGNVAMDAARTALRMGSEKVYIVYRRSHQELPARAEEIHHAEEEGVVFKFLSNPLGLEGDEKGRVQKMKCQEMELGPPDQSGRRRPVPKAGSEFYIDTDLVIMAIGAGANPLLPKATKELSLNKWGYIVADEKGRTTKQCVWAGGDIVTGSATVIEAMGAGKRSAADIHAFLSNGQGEPWLQPKPEAPKA
jgi:glutamate synthase (NADPH/NADH) small chain